MAAQLEIQTDVEATDSLLTIDLELEKMGSSPDLDVPLKYREYKDFEYVRISARNEHPEKTIHASFYTLHNDKDEHGVDATLGYTINTCLKPFETTILHLNEKKHNPRFIMYNVYFSATESNYENK